GVAAVAGVLFVRHIGSTSEKFYVDSVPGGLAIFDYNGDGRPDIFFTDGAELPSLEKRLPAYANRLYRNEGNMRFTDVTDEAGVAGVGYAMGVAAADYDNDGHVDLFVAGVRRNQLLRNRGDGRFDDVTARAGIAGGEWAVAAGWLDYDNDGRLDIFVTNDTVPNYLFHNNGDGTFSDIALLAGVSVPDTGRPVSAMGADVQDYDNDGWDDILFAALAGETFPLFRNDRRGAFVE